LSQKHPLSRPSKSEKLPASLESCRNQLSRNVRATLRIDGDGVAYIASITAKVRRIGKRCAGRIEFDNEGITNGALNTLKSVRKRKVRRIGAARNVSAALRIDGDGKPCSPLAPPRKLE
jgi:hypothetical protein